MELVLILTNTNNSLKMHLPEKRSETAKIYDKFQESTIN
ncbi:hypothetical protein CLV73_0358 [Chryseobacterium geocarposphaerae]|uniref:Uncharacterized protein n=1 Tax=Chryseobacterium geocarposphaerae TaxID=1416776 RepID=A0A2M9C6E5_9FLAO|nr:hypothetical protein CLV73_0358 [Chryseobacterium geocarposphaerae]